MSANDDEGQERVRSAMALLCGGYVIVLGAMALAVVLAGASAGLVAFAAGATGCWVVGMALGVLRLRSLSKEERS